MRTRTLELVTVDAFTDVPFAGNPAGVALVDAFPDAAVMQAVAREMNLSETAFVVAREDGDHDLRWLTPTTEVELCGHATLASAHVLGGDVYKRQDGWFVTAVKTTGIYCRPSCPARPPYARNLCFLPTAAAAQRAGYRACKRCRPDASPGSPEWNVRQDLVGRAMRLIADGTVDRIGVTGLATRLGYSTRQLERHLVAEVGAGPLALARAQRAQTARLLIETTGLPLSLIHIYTLRQQFIDGTPMRRPGEPEDIACAVLYLVSDASSRCV